MGWFIGGFWGGISEFCCWPSWVPMASREQGPKTGCASHKQNTKNNFILLSHEQQLEYRWDRIKTPSPVSAATRYREILFIISGRPDPIRHARAFGRASGIWWQGAAGPDRYRPARRFSRL